MPTSQLVRSDSNILYTPLQKSLFRFAPAYTYLTTAAAYPSEINKTDVRNLNFKANPRTTDYRAATITWNDDKHWNRTVALAADLATTGTTVTLSAADASTIVDNQILKVDATGEQLLVTAHPSSTTLTVVRQFGTTEPLVKADSGTTLTILGTALFDRDKGSAMRSPVMTDFYTNYMQTLDVSYEITEGTDYYDFQGGKVLPRLTKEGAMEAAYTLEDTFWYSEGKQYADPTNANNIKQTMIGLIPFVKANGKLNVALDGNTALSLDIMQSFESNFEPDSTNKAVWLCSKKALAAIDGILQSSQRITSADTINLAIGMRVKVFHSTMRDIELVHCPALDKPFNKVDIVRYNPAEYMELLATKGGWQYKECEKDLAQTYQKYWLHGTFGAKFHLCPDVAGTISNIKSPFVSLS